jgi:sulfite reductase (NADPH) flavoprotein alpha-component
MTRTDLPGPGLTEEQWDRLKGLAISLTVDQANWVGGYFTGYADAARHAAGTAIAQPPVIVPASAPAAVQRSLTILYGSETGTALSLGEALAQEAGKLGLVATAVDMADYKPSALKQEQDLLVITSTHGEGEPPQPALGFFEFITSRKAPRLDDVRFAVLALGDSTYEFYCESGKKLDRRFEELGATRLEARIDCDVDQIGQGRSWAIRLLETLAREKPIAAAPAIAVPSAAPMAASFDQANPFAAEVLENLVITGRGSSKETRHLEISLEGSGLTYQPGDALGIVGQNDPRVVAELLDCLGLDPDQPLSGHATPLGQTLQTGFEIATATPKFLAHWAELSGASALAALSGPDKASERFAFLEAHHVVDIVRHYPVTGLSGETLIAGLRALQPRLYSIASSQEAQDGDVHLTVSTVRYQLHGSERWGVVSGGLSRLSEAEATLPVYVKPNPHFRLPADDVPIIMLGAGTGVAPYRAFMQQRELRNAAGRSWLFFGDRNFRSDFLYQAEWQAQLKSGALTRMDVAFSRDAAGKAYVQHRLREQARDVFAWLEQGAHFYVCGDAKGMAPDVHQALLALVAEQGGLSPEKAEDYVRTLQRDGRYQRDVY